MTVSKFALSCFQLSYKSSVGQEVNKPLMCLVTILPNCMEFNESFLILLHSDQVLYLKNLASGSSHTCFVSGVW